MAESDVRNSKCTICGGADFEWGRLHQAMHDAGIMFAEADEHSFFGTAGHFTKVRCCRNCGHIDIFAVRT